MNKSRDRSNNFELMHFAAAAFVMFGHQYDLMGGNAPTVMGMTIHSLSVRVIFLIVGYLITESWYHSGSAAVYLGKRVKRIFPPLILNIVLTIVILGLICSSYNFGEYLRLSEQFFFHNICLSPKFDLPGVFENNIFPRAVNGALWTLPVEFMSYLLIIPVMKLCDLLGKYGNILLGILVAAMWTVCILFNVGVLTGSFVVWGTDWISALQLAVYFWAGAFFSRAKLKKYCNLQVGLLLGILCSIMFGIWQLVVYLPILTYITFSFAFTEKPAFAGFKARFSYELYLYAFPVQQCFIQLLIIRTGKMQSLFLMFAISFAVTVLLSIAASKLVEALTKKSFWSQINAAINAPIDWEKEGMEEKSLATAQASEAAEPEEEAEKSEEVKQEKPEETKREKAEEARCEKAKEVKQEKPEKIKREKAEEAKQEKPEKIKQKKSEEVSQSAPDEADAIDDLEIIEL